MVYRFEKRRGRHIQPQEGVCVCQKYRRHTLSAEMFLCIFPAQVYRERQQYLFSFFATPRVLYIQGLG